MEGWIKVHRKLLDNPITSKDSDYLAVWIYLLLNATHKEYDTLFKGKRITLQKGQLITGRKTVCNKLKISESKVQNILKTFEIEHQIEQQMSNQNRLITVLSWEQYQNIEHQIKQQVNNDQTTTEQQLNTNNNVKNIKNNKNDKNVINKKNNKEVIQEEYMLEVLENWEVQFEDFYKKYPKKVKKQDVKKWFEKNKPSSELFSSMMNSLEQFRGSKEWLKDNGQYIPYPSTWLNQKRWEDEDIENSSTGNPFFDLLREERKQ